MNKEFNITGTCIPEKHYMVDVSSKLKKIVCLIDQKKYLSISKPRQYGKTTFLYLLDKHLNKLKDYLALRISFEGIGDEIFLSETEFSKIFIELIEDELSFHNYKYCFAKDINDGEKINMKKLSRLISMFVKNCPKKVILIIDEVDKSSNNQLFLSFIGMLRDKYLKRNEGKDFTYDSVILVGVHDIKNLKLKMLTDHTHKYNSPWNIASDLTFDLNFQPQEIRSMLKDYSIEKNIQMDLDNISELLFYYTFGYPFLVSHICKIIDEEIKEEKFGFNWSSEHIELAVHRTLNHNNTNFESLIKNLENNDELYNLVRSLIIKGTQKTYNISNPLIDIGTTYGVFKNENKMLKIHNRIYEQLIYNYMTSKIETSIDTDPYNYRDNFIRSNGSLDVEKILIKFQEFMKNEYSKKDKDFLERNGRLIFLAFLKPIINGNGFDFKEVQISEEKRLDIIVTWLKEKYIIELKIWRGKIAHQKGIDQLYDYMKRLDLNKGYLIIFDIRTDINKVWKKEFIKIKNKEIFAIFV
ncbi:AAA ATPase [Candidatus Magnetomorum sp. HK-1]|nr:AAA ATPase [Candidatus Magnetomorum sp. HK-1]